MIKADYPRCRTCKHYEEATCVNPKLKSYEDDGMIAGTEEGSYSELTHYSDEVGPQSVGPDFGCVHHSELNDG